MAYAVLTYNDRCGSSCGARRDVDLSMEDRLRDVERALRHRRTGTERVPEFLTTPANTGQMRSSANVGEERRGVLTSASARSAPK